MFLQWTDLPFKNTRKVHQLVNKKMFKARCNFIWGSMAIICSLIYHSANIFQYRFNLQVLLLCSVENFYFHIVFSIHEFYATGVLVCYYCKKMLTRIISFALLFEKTLRQIQIALDAKFSCLHFSPSSPSFFPTLFPVNQLPVVNLMNRTGPSVSFNRKRPKRTTVTKHCRENIDSSWFTNCQDCILTFIYYTLRKQKPFPLNILPNLFQPDRTFHNSRVSKSARLHFWI